jgi:hypothetical protein
MQTLRSDFQRLCQVHLPYKARQKYMHSFDLAKPIMAEGYEDYLEPVLALCRDAGAFQGIAHMTVDEKYVQSGRSQRRPRPHVDGCFMPELDSWGHPPGPYWLHYCNALPIQRMKVIVASSVQGCKAWKGTYKGEPKNDGDLSDLHLGDGMVLPANAGYLLSADCIHESMIFDKSTKRSFLRIALPVEVG